MDKLFIWVWRINGLLILLGILLLGIVISLDFIQRRVTHNPEPSTTSIAADPEGKERWVLMQPQQVLGTDYVYMSLVSENAGVETSDGKLGMIGSGDYKRKKSKNILFYNELAGDAAWLFNDVDQLISAVTELPKRSYTDRYLGESIQKPRKTIAITYSVVSNDTNNDGVVNDEDDAALALTNAIGEGYKIVLDKYERILSESLIGEDTVSIIYQLEGTVYNLKYSMTSSSVLSNFQLPAVGQ